MTVNEWLEFKANMNAEINGTSVDDEMKKLVKQMPLGDFLLRKLESELGEYFPNRVKKEQDER